MRVLLLLLSALAWGCGPSDIHTLHLAVTTPEGDERSATLRGQTSWEIDSLGKPFASWPDVAEWGVDTELGLNTEFYPYQPGTYAVFDAFLIVDGEVHDASATLHTERVHWTGSPHYPFEQEGSLEGQTADGLTFEGSFDTGTDDCRDVLGSDTGCGASSADAEMADQSWTIGTWVDPVDAWDPVSETWVSYVCPPEVLDVYFGGEDFTLSMEQGAQAGGGRPLECVITYPNGYKAICGDDTEVEADGCTWALVATATPAGMAATPSLTLNAGTVGDCPTPRICARQAGAWSAAP